MNNKSNQKTKPNEKDKTVCELICDIGKTAQELYTDSRDSNEQAYYFGIMTVAAQIAMPILRGRKQGVVDLNYRRAKLAYDAAEKAVTDITEEKELFEVLDTLKKLIHKLNSKKE